MTNPADPWAIIERALGDVPQAEVVFDALSEAGFVVVPVEPTEAQMDAGDDAIRDGLEKAQFGIPFGLHNKHASWNVYRAMIAAASEGAA